MTSSVITYSSKEAMQMLGLKSGGSFNPLWNKLGMKPLVFDGQYAWTELQILRMMEEMERRHQPKKAVKKVPVPKNTSFSKAKFEELANPDGEDAYKESIVRQLRTSIGAVAKSMGANGYNYCNISFVEKETNPLVLHSYLIALRLQQGLKNLP
jgi:hypothetical protein